MQLKDIPRVKGRAVTGNAAAMQDDPLALFLSISREHGDLARVNVFGYDALFVNSPQLIQEILVEKETHFRKDLGFRLLLHPLIGNGLANVNGDRWRKARKMVAPIFQPKQIAQFASYMPDYAVRVSDRWQEGAEVDLLDEMLRVIMGITGKVVFDVPTFHEADGLGDAFKETGKWLSQQGAVTPSLAVRILALRALASWRPGPAKQQIEAFLYRPPLWPNERNLSFQKAMKFIEQRFATMIEERRSAPAARRDLLTILVGARDEQGMPMVDQQIMDEALNLFAAGIESTSHTVAWALYLVSQHPEVRARLEAEVDALGDHLPTFEDLPRLPFALQTFKEAMRLYPPAAVMSREVIEGAEVDGCALPADMLIFMSAYALHRREDFWPDPETFDPDRFTAAAERSRPRTAYLPFGAGPRVCIGNHFAMMEGQLVLATLAQRYRLELRPGYEVKLTAYPVLHPKGGLPMRVTRRARSLPH